MFDDVILVSDASIIVATKLLQVHTGLTVEPSGATSIASVLKNRNYFKESTFATIICGGNLMQE